MKIFSFLFISFIAFAQTPYTDTLVLRNNKSFPCIVKFIDEEKIDIFYGKKTNITTVLQAVKEVNIEGLGKVYSSDDGFIVTQDVIKNFLEERKEKIEAEILLQKEADKFSVHEEGSESTEILNLNSEFSKWAFGVLYIPYNTGRVYTYSTDSYYQQQEVYSYSASETNLEAEISYGISSDVRLNFNVTYSSTFTERRNESYTRSDPGSVYSQGSLSTEGLKLIDLNFGVKYYLRKFISDKAVPYFLLGFGKQFAFSEEEQKILFQTTPSTTITENNREEFIKELNSPWHFNIGFGAEYFFNEFLSLNSNIRFIYSKVSAKYRSRSISQFETRTTSEEYTHSDFVTKVGIGFNFYF